jgi:hypothetical protein
MMAERLTLRALDALTAWCVSDAAACRQLSAASNLLWRASLLARAAGSPPAEPGARLLGALAPFPRLAPRLQRSHVDSALSLLSGLTPRDGAVAELLAAAERLAALAGEAGGGGGGGGGGGAGLLLGLRQAVAGATGARLQACLELAAVRAALVEGGARGGGGAAEAEEEEEPPGAALAAAAAKLAALAREWEAGALLRALGARGRGGAGGLRALEGAVWAATGGARTLRAAVDV